jgi:predicted nucleic acid-binding protein
MTRWARSVPQAPTHAVVILVDTSIWIAHLRTTDAALAQLLQRGAILAHPWVVGELALGNLRQQCELVALLSGLPQATVATPVEVLTLIDNEQLPGMGIGYVDAQLLAATRLTGDAALWSADRRLQAAAVRLGCAFAAAPGDAP